MNPRHLLIAAAITGLASAASAQYKIVAPDGGVTYTDRPPVAQPGTVTPLRPGATAAAAPAGPDASLPIELRQIAARYPVTLYSGANCQPCDSGRQLLQQRGVPYSERSVSTEEDSAALARLSGGRTLPSLLVGLQPLRGFNPTDWSSYLDAAGYPRESRLPRNWQPPAVTPLVARESAPARTAAAPAQPESPRVEIPPPAPPAASGIRF
jgi:glutaredoxin